MGLELDPRMILFFALGLVLLYITGWLLLAPFHFLLKLALNSVIGAIVLVLLNLIGTSFSFVVPINAVSALVVGAFGLPGLLLLLVLKLIFV